MLLATPASAWGLARHPVVGAVSLSGVHDLRPLVLFSFNADFKLDDAEAARQSPILLRPATDAPIVVAAGAEETSEFVRQAQLLWEAWPANRPQGAYGPMLIPHRNHFSIVADYADAQSALTRATLALF
jgi:arylformamidase